MLAELARNGTTFRLATPLDSLPDAIWPEISLGRSCATFGWCWYHGQVFAGAAARRPVRPGDFDLTAVWSRASRAGYRAAALDVPLTGPSPGLDGIHLREWGAHDAPFTGMSSDPPELLAEVLRRFGEHPLPHRYGDGTRCDDQDGSHAYLTRLLGLLLEGAERKAEMVRAVLDEDDWDLFVASFSEAHCAGHHFWHFSDESSPWYSPDAPPQLADSLRSVYARLDASLGHVLEGAGSDTVVLVLLSHGMGPSRGGWQVLPEVLVRLGYGSGHGSASSVRSVLPAPLRAGLRRVLGGRARRRLQEAAGSLRDPLESPATRAVALPNAPCGAIRLNVAGREPFGSVDPGAEYDEACDELVAELLALENVASGTPAVASVERATDVFGGSVHPNVPDLIVRFSADQPLIPGVRSRRVGTVTSPVYTSSLPRTGEHAPEARLFAVGPGIAASGNDSSGHVLDIVPTVLQLLGAQLPDALDGRPLPLQRS